MHSTGLTQTLSAMSWSSFPPSPLPSLKLSLSHTATLPCTTTTLYKTELSFFTCRERDFVYPPHSRRSPIDRERPPVTGEQVGGNTNLPVKKIQINKQNILISQILCQAISPFYFCYKILVYFKTTKHSKL
ncbi:unnamed protein product [Bubo scandiacus]